MFIFLTGRVEPPPFRAGRLHKLVKSQQTDGTVKSFRCKARASFKAVRRPLFKPPGAILRNEAYLVYVAMIYPVKSAPPSRVARI